MTSRTKARTEVPRFRTLTQRECDELLRRQTVGRLAYCSRDRVDIEPISFVFARGALYGRMSQGSKFDTLQHHPWVAFEVDEVEGPNDWSSVVVHGAVYVLEGEKRADALELLRTVFPQVDTDDDPTPWREIVFHVVPDEITGRQATTEA